MKKILFVAITALSASAYAIEPEVYAGASYSSWQFEATGGPGNMTGQALEGAVGVNLLDYLAIEARVGGGISGDQDSSESPFVAAVVDDNDTPADNTDDIVTTPEIPARTLIRDFELKYYASVYLKPQLSNDKASLYGLIGYTNTEIEAAYDSPTEVDAVPGSDPLQNTVTVPATTVIDDSFSGLSVGVGVSFTYSEQLDFTFEWKKLINASDFDMRGGTIGFKYSF